MDSKYSRWTAENVEKVTWNCGGKTWQPSLHQFYPQGTGYVVAIWLLGFEEENTVVWTAYRDDPPVSPNSTLELTHKEELVLRPEQGGVNKTIATNISFAVMNNTGNFVLYNDHMGVVWQSCDHPTDSMLQGQSLFGESELVSSVSETNYSSGRFRIKMQTDGNLVMYPTNTMDQAADASWASGTSNNLGMGTSKNYLLLNNTGFLLMNGSNADVVKDLHSEPSHPVIYRATLGLDGIFRLYSYNLTNSPASLVWKAPDYPCAVKSLCGFNSYCTMNDEQPYCVCLPGSVFVDPDWEDSGCERNFTKARCKSGNDNMTYYEMVAEEQLKVEDHPYYVGTEEKEDCKKSCLEDCDCDAALLQGGRCTKHKLPLKYVRRVYFDQEKYTSFFKKGTISFNASSPHGKVVTKLSGNNSCYHPWLFHLFVHFPKFVGIFPIQVPSSKVQEIVGK